MNGQEEAIKRAKGPCVILAGAGTGKTYTIVEKIKYLVNNDIYEPDRIVCITFSNEAVNNLLSRVQKALSLKEGKQPIIKTFHAFSAELLRKYGGEIGINKDFNILTPDDAKVVLHRFLKVSVGNCHKYIGSIGTAKDLGINLESLREYLDGKLRDFENIDLEKRLESLNFELKTLYLRKDKWKTSRFLSKQSNLDGAQEPENLKVFDKKEFTGEASKISNLLDLKKFVCAWEAYEKIKQVKNYQDYSDLNKNALKLLRENKEIARDYEYIIVDEFQDTNKIQLELLFCLAPNGNVSVVGDFNQSIYRFRGAYNKNFYEFKEKFNVSKNDIFNLDKSYRSSNKILRAAHRLILNNYGNPAECFEVLNFNNRGGEKIEVYDLKNAREEARKVIELAEKEIGKGVETREICVMFRTHQQGRVIKKALEFKRIPYVSVTKSPLLKERNVKRVIDYLTILNKLKKRDKGGEEAWWDLIYQLNFAEEDLIKIGRFIKDNKDAENICAVMLNSLCEIKLSDNGMMAGRILIERIKRLIPIGDNVPEIIKEVYNIGGFINSQKTKEEKTIMLNLNRFYDLAKEHSVLYDPDLGSFIYYLGILDSLGIEIDAADSEEDGIRLMTLHATKGLEYKTVIITNLAQKRFPLEHFNNNYLIPAELSPEFSDMPKEDLEYYLYEKERQNQLFEERRLCYVAFTRAKEKLILTYANEYEQRKFYPSQFLNEVGYKENPDFNFNADLEEKYTEPEAAVKSSLGFASVLKSWDFDNVIAEVAKNANRRIEFNANEISFSPSALLTFAECQKKYEYKYIYNMPEQKSVSWEAIMLGSFVHRVLERGVKCCFGSLKEFEDLAKEMQLESDWEQINLTEALHLIKVFFERNKNKYGRKSKTEQVLKINLCGLNFIGFADRIDFNDNGIEIIDYKTGRSSIHPLSRDWQMGYYALAASQLGRVRRIVLDMLRHEKPLEFELDEQGNARAVYSYQIKGFNIYNVEQELVKTAHQIIDAYKNGFKPCAIEKNCEFCEEWVWKL